MGFLPSRGCGSWRSLLSSPRRWEVPPWPLHDGHSLYWVGLNQGKRSVTIDTRSEEGRRQVAKLIAAPGEGAASS